MAQNKKSIWSTIILIATIVSLVLLILGVIALVVGIPGARELARQAAVDGGATADEAGIIATIAVTTIIVAFVLSSVLDVLKIIGGFMFSLKGRWGIFCIIVSILGAVGAVVSLINDIRNHAGTLSIVTSGLTLAVDALLVVACFKHKIENGK